MIVELDIFSGRPNPRLELDDDDAGKLRRLQSSLRPSVTAAPQPPPLGYRGFTYDSGGSTRVYKGYVQTPEGVLADSLCSIEQFLLGRLPGEFRTLGIRILSELRP